MSQLQQKLIELQTSVVEIQSTLAMADWEPDDLSRLELANYLADAIDAHRRGLEAINRLLGDNIP